MLRRIGVLATFAMCFSAAAPLIIAQNETIPLSSLTKNNTAACSAVPYGLLEVYYCQEIFPGNTWPFAGWDDDEWVFNAQGQPQNEAPVDTEVQDPSPMGTWNISKGRNSSKCCNIPAPTDMHRLMYGNGTGSINTTVMVELQSWFCDPGEYNDTGTLCNATPPNWQPPFQNLNDPVETILEYESHGDVGYSSWYQPSQNARAVDIWDRGGDVTAWDWYGQSNDCPPPCATMTCSYNWQQNFNEACAEHFQQANYAWQDMVSAIQNLPTQRPGSNMQFFLILDANTWTGICAGGSANGGAYEPQCALDKTINDLNEAITSNNGWLNPQSSAYSSYFKVATAQGMNKWPVIGIFQSELGPGNLAQCNTMTCYYDDNLDKCTGEQTCFQDMYAALRAWLDTTALGSNYYLIFTEQSGCPAVHTSSDGCYQWIKPETNALSSSDITIDNQEYNDPTDPSANPKVQADNFYANSLNQTGTNGQPALIIGAAYKGFDDDMAHWRGGRIMTQGCGTTWYSTWEEMTWDPVNNKYRGPNAYYNSATNPLNYIMVDTWDDYEEGSEIETGIDNCLNFASFQLTLTGEQLTWQYKFDTSRDIAALASPVTVDHYELYDSTDGENFTALDVDISPSAAGCSFSYPLVACSTGISLSNYQIPGASVYIRIAGVPGITNWLSVGYAL